MTINNRYANGRHLQQNRQLKHLENRTQLNHNFVNVQSAVKEMGLQHHPAKNIDGSNINVANLRDSDINFRNCHLLQRPDDIRLARRRHTRASSHSHRRMNAFCQSRLTQDVVV